MKSYQTFIFDSYAFDRENAEITLRYTLDNKVEFVEKLTLPRRGIHVRHLPHGLLDRALFALHLIGGMSYYKTCCPKEIIIHSGTLTEAQAQFWNEVYENGLGEFFYQNNIDFRNSIHFPVSAKEPQTELSFTQHNDRVLVPIGGGKDSMVTIELLRRSGFHCTMFRMGPNPLIKELAEQTTLPLLSIERTLSSALFTLNADGALNGHIPITAYLSFLAIVTALLYESRTVVMSNERSANVGSLLFHGKEINHQWSKSLAFERLFQEYLRTFITPDIQYFSLLRPWSELRITHAFSHFPQYFDCTTSCNTNWKITKPLTLSTDRVERGKPATNLWCCSCAKCAFTFALYAAFLPKEKILHIFKKNFFEEQTLLPTYMALLGIEGVKPFECVGTPEETKTAFLLIRERGEFNDTPVMQLFFERELPHITNTAHYVRDALDPTVDHAIPPTFATVLSESPS
ncbi:hypothetical protein A3H22_01785 [Candidatus Peribacteria bacterium RIFCSPLOWO2_12_FULL_55_15]|nr:MAG: hypothetical protein A2789_03305 [Candidatus Peribacteria bacterium RIFCSPHIGHO2_01_FULL_54_22]OGJ63408.1 MAG: hypothetical protein A3D12_04135 [Candidatus Peribacteria bacterium RIFCSPHIGHO2_02_FULL_55_24]OGJ64438.1 MAG: hypothetical protein A3E47_00860 [Candidatus Peribacteria bacterium RIFCSPHIGHO2_12_FULL_54_10]OGJ67989.1 MAG: hypothetical protein A2947_00800 [Candidatus Peribacteria bacterium RIFCSPLOWO2_01_FULL_54_110]OGJ70827.1 MAG: hypothetical protein A3H22_01785 [Candidatus Pe